MGILFSDGKVVLEDEVIEADLYVEDGMIEEIGDIDPGEVRAEKIKDISGNYILPGIIDAHTHYALNSRGTVTEEGFFSGTSSAARGGVTSFIDFSPHREDRSLPSSARARIDQARESSVIDFNLHQTVHYYDEDVAEELERIREMGISSIKLFTTYKDAGYLVSASDRVLLMERCDEVGLLPTVHAEDDDLVEKAKNNMLQGVVSADDLKMNDHPDLRPARAEAEAIEGLCRQALEQNLPLYVDHISSAAGLDKLLEYRKSGARIAGETTPHYLFLDRSFLEGDEPEKYFMVPPLREKKDCQRLIQALKDEELDVVATDHCAFSLQQKRQRYNPLEMLPGIPGSETLLPLIHELLVVREGADYSHLSRFLSTNPARLFGLYPQRGVIREGSVADLVILDPDCERSLSEENLHSAAGYSPYSHISVSGYPVMTVARGEIIVEEDEYRGERGRGEFIEADISSLL